MNNIKLITYSCANNYGAVLQTYALYKVLKLYADDVKIIDYITERYNVDNPTFGDKALSTSKWKYIPIIRQKWKARFVSQMKENRKPFRDFLQKNVVFTDPYYDLDELVEARLTADVFITGSDQLWNPEYLWTGIVDEPYYCGFLNDNQKRISYATSFGKNKLTQEEMDAAKPYLNKYAAISVREQSGVEILDEMKLKGIEVVDPTLLAGKEIFDALISPKTISSKYVLLFQIDFKRNLYKAAEQYAKEIEKQLIVIVPDIKQVHHSIQNIVNLPAVEEWLWYIKNADYIITDSFHGTVFSIIYNKKFISSMTAGNNGRIRNVLKATGLNGRALEIVNYTELKKIAEEEIDYKQVNMRVEVLRSKSLSWLEGNLL